MSETWSLYFWEPGQEGLRLACLIQITIPLEAGTLNQQTYFPLIWHGEMSIDMVAVKLSSA